MENVLEQLNVTTISLESATTGIIQGFIQDDINQEVMSLLEENIKAEVIIAKLECFRDPLFTEVKELLSNVVQKSLLRIEALQTQIM